MFEEPLVGSAGSSVFVEPTHPVSDPGIVFVDLIFVLIQAVEGALSL
jgi:hypothetical protein